MEHTSPSRSRPNRVDPFGTLIATSARGAFMGNRGGRIHLDDCTLGPRRWASKRWICCRTCFKGRARTVWGAGYTELFFLDEATSLAAGHRPCFECRRAEAEAFRLAAFGRKARVDDIDAALHVERLAPRPAIDMEAAGLLPEGAMVGDRANRVAWLRVADGWRRWTPHGYAEGEPEGAGLALLTPATTLRAFARGYAPQCAACDSG